MRTPVSRIRPRRSVSILVSAATLLACSRKSAPTYHEDIAPILASSCVGCHRSAGVAPVPLLETYAQVREAAGKVRRAVETRMMPPWGADNTGLCRTWKGALALPAADIQMLTKWTESPMEEGDPARARPRTPDVVPFHPSGVTLDQGVDFAPGLGPSAYRCFVVDPALPRDRLLTAIRVGSTEPRSVQQLTLYALDTAEADQAASALDAGEEGPGYTCYGSSRVPAARLVTSWTWDALVLRMPEGSGVLLRGGHQLVLQAHYDPITTGIDVPTRTHVDLELEDSGQRTREASFLNVLPDDFALPPGRPHVEASGRLGISRPLTVLGVAPRMHSRAKTLELALIRTGKRECIANFDHWDFYQQRFFEYSTPFTLEPGDAVQVSCVYDTEGRQEPTRMGEGIDDEECLASLLVH
ncbi:MAG TPA: hypothetical protein VF395_03785 [Polyangiaceae bacterium]